MHQLWGERETEDHILDYCGTPCSSTRITLTKTAQQRSPFKVTWVFNPSPGLKIVTLKLFPWSSLHHAYFPADRCLFHPQVQLDSMQTPTRPEQSLDHSLSPASIGATPSTASPLIALQGSHTYTNTRHSCNREVEGNSSLFWWTEYLVLSLNRMGRGCAAFTATRKG